MNLQRISHDISISRYINGYEGICHWYIDGMQSNMIVSRWDIQGDSNWKLLAVCLLGVLAQVVPLEFAWNSGKKRRAGIWVIGWWGHIYNIIYIYIYIFNIRYYNIYIYWTQWIIYRLRGRVEFPKDAGKEDGGEWGTQWPSIILHYFSKYLEDPTIRNCPHNSLVVSPRSRSGNLYMDYTIW